MYPRLLSLCLFFGATTSWSLPQSQSVLENAVGPNPSLVNETPVSPSTQESKQAYLDKFMTYMDWCQHLPTTPDPRFDAFIKEVTPLTKKLREKWLYQLAYNKNWPVFIQYYQDNTQDTNLQCYAQIARYNLDRRQEAFEAAKKLWLNGNSQPIACDNLFKLLLNNHELSDDLILKRMHLALANRNVSLARHLLKQLKPPRIQEADLLTRIYQNPTRISELQPSFIHGEFYLYGLQLMLSRKTEQAIKFWNLPQAKKVMNEAQQQAFLIQLCLYKSLRNEPDVALWFSKIKPTFYTTALLEWGIRHALTHKNWQRVINLINYSQDKEEPIWQYWKARAYKALHQDEKATPLFTELAKKRNYYGFLASMQLKKKLSFENEPASQNIQTLAIYKPITDQIKTLYSTHQNLSAARLLYDFSSELPKEDKSALTYWVYKELNWHGKSVFLSNSEELKNQLSLRFPLAHHHTVSQCAEQYQIPKEFIYAVIRQESAFNDDIVSSAGANGLMQLMPATAKVVAQRARIPYQDKKQLFSSQTNINIGTAYLQQLAHQFASHPVLIAAAYNAGPRQVRYWLQNHPPKEIDIWIETLPWKETRNYLKNIIAFYAVYQYRIQEKKPNLNAFIQPFR